VGANPARFGVRGRAATDAVADAWFV